MTELRKNIIKDFISFLKKHEAFEKYSKFTTNKKFFGWNEVWADLEIQNYKGVKEFLEKGDPYTFICGAFLWAETKEENFWAKLHDEWKRFYSNKL